MDYQTIDDYRGDIKERLARIETILNRELPDIKDQLKIANGRTRSLEEKVVKLSPSDKDDILVDVVFDAVVKLVGKPKEKESKS